MARRSEHSLEEIKLMVLDAAEEIVQKEGFSALKIRRIVADIGYTVGSVYMVFANMDDLHVQLKTRTLLSLLHACESAHDIDSLAQEYVLFVQRERGVWGMLFTHQSEKILAADKDYELAQIALSIESCLYLGNLDALRDWGHAKDYVRMQWMMLQQKEADDFVIATGKQISVREFVRLSASELGIELEFTGEGVGEIGTVKFMSDETLPGISIGDIIVRVDPRYFRPTEVETLLGDPAKAKAELGWAPEITVEKMCAEMIENDLDIAKRHALLKAHGHNISISSEN